MAPAVAYDETNALVIPTSESDMVSAQGSRRKYMGAVALFALVAVIVGGVGMHRHSVHSNGQDAEIGDIIEACAGYTVQASCSAASCNWNSATVQCEEAAHRQKKASFLSTAAEREVQDSDSSNSSATTPVPSATTPVPSATTPVPNTVAADGTITTSLVVSIPSGATSVVLTDATGVNVGDVLIIGSEQFTVVSITFLTRRLTEGSRRLSTSATVGFTPATSSTYAAGTSVSIQSQEAFDRDWWATHGDKFGYAGEAFKQAAAKARAELSAMAAPV